MNKGEFRRLIIRMVDTIDDRAQNAANENGKNFASAHWAETGKVYEEAKTLAAQNGFTQKQLDVFWNEACGYQERKNNIH